MGRRQGLGRASLLASVALGLTAGYATTGSAQVLLEQGFPTVNLGYQSDYLRRGSGYGQLPETPNQAATAPGVTVLSRPHPEYDPLGLRFGDVSVRAGATEGIGYNFNPLALSTSRGSGFVASQAALNVSNDRERSGVNAGMTVQDLHYFDLSEVNHTDWTAIIGGHYDLERGRLDASYSHLNLNILPTSIEHGQEHGQNRGGALHGRYLPVALHGSLRAFTLIPQVSYSIYRFGQSVGINGTRERTGSTRPSTTATNCRSGRPWNTSSLPDAMLVLLVRGTEANFTDNPIGGPNQDFSDVQVLTGLDVQTQGKFRYRALVGYEERSYRAAALKTQNTPSL